ncbi:MAG TPA: hypothetical protein VFB72_03510 [Verrucomicrobiae bacterium]|nr:hypothetical protein [Verrucomicrobiae bacterium]
MNWSLGQSSTTLCAEKLPLAALEADLMDQTRELGPMLATLAVVGITEDRLDEMSSGKPPFAAIAVLADEVPAIALTATTQHKSIRTKLLLRFFISPSLC